MRSFWKGLVRIIFLMMFGFVTVTLTLFSVRESQKIPLQRDISATTNVSKGLPLAHKKAVVRSRQSSVRVVSVATELGGMSTSSGTYIKFRDEFYVLTVAHGLIGGCDGTAVMTAEGLYQCQELMDLNLLIDYGIFRVEEIIELEAVEVPQHLPRGKQWLHDFSVMTETYYTGFPNGMGPFTINGQVIGYNENDFLYIQSYGWSGCSGAGVFSESGRLMAYILALTVGQTQYGFNVSEDVVIAVPLFKINWLSLVDATQEKKDEEKESTESRLSDSASSDSGPGHSD